MTWLSRRGSCRRTEADVARLSRWLLDRGVSLVALAGNHDRPRPGQNDSLDVKGWTIAHGHRPVVAPRTITGHLHPVLRADGVSARCFLVDESVIVLPAFSGNAAGVNIEALAVCLPNRRSLRCVAIAGNDVLDFGPVPSLVRALRA